MNAINRKFLYLFLFGLLGCTGGSKDESVSTVSEADIAKVKLKELDDQTIELSQVEGKTVFINFWATWCKPCIQEMPTIESAQNVLKNENVIFLLASNENPDEIEKFIKKCGYNLHYVHLENLEALNITAIGHPRTVSVSRLVPGRGSGSRYILWRRLHSSWRDRRH